jgi:transcriptional regulator with XRE-family HTH domain
LRQWRQVRRISQLGLATAADISGRHVCFLETGRAQPSREMVQLLANVLCVPLNEQNTMLVAAGYAPVYGQRELSAPDLDHVRRALQFILRQQEPYPAIVVDGKWNILMKNEAAQRIFGMFRSPAGEKAEWPNNSMRTVFDPMGLRPFIVDWEQVAGHLIHTLHGEAASGLHPGTASLLNELLSYPGVPTKWKYPDPSLPMSPLLTLKLRKEETSLCFFSTVTSFATPRDITLQQLRIECFYPADTATEDTARRLAGH